MTRLEVSLENDRRYDIVFGRGALSDLGRHCANCARSRRAVILTESRIARRWGAAAAESLEHAGFAVDTIAFTAGEARKNLATIARLYGDLYNLPAIDRKTLLVALGGGVVGDMVGFVAATYLRGMDCVQVPTTLLAMVDSSVGGKTGVDFREGKNLIGAFHQPRCVVVDPDVLATLPRREARSGMAEVVKYGIIRDPAILETVAEQGEALFGDPETLLSLIVRSCEIKAEVVQGDEREETGLRAILNYGHTIGHALEGATGYRRYKHGEAVAVGMVSAACIGEAAGVTPGELRPVLVRALECLSLPTQLPADIDDAALLALAGRDKKSVAGEARFVLARALGDVALKRVPLDVVCEGLRRHRAEGQT